jgi:hypothetical protein
MIRFRSYKSRFLITSLFCALAWTLSYASEAQARNLFVSQSGDGTTATSWKTAWKSFQTIDWSQVVAGDQIIVDGGAGGVTYKGAFSIPVSGVIIRQSSAAGRNGVVTISGDVAQQVPIGVTISGSNVRLVGNTRGGIKITSFGSELVRVLTNGNVLRNIRIGGVTGFPPYGSGRVGCLVFGGTNNHFVNCDFRDFNKCAVESPVAGVPNVNVFNGCTFGNDFYGWWSEWGTGIYGARPGATAVDSKIYASKCVFGPILNRCVDVVQGKLNVSDSLFLGSNFANLSFEPPVGSTAVANVTKCTFYEPNFSTPLGQQPPSYAMFLYNISTNGNGVLKVKDSIVYGGVVHVPATQSISLGGNFQYHVTGNTTALASAIVNPLFVDENKLWTQIWGKTIIPREWTVQSYALSANSAALGKGSTITSVTSIVPAYGPASQGLPLQGGP